MLMLNTSCNILILLMNDLLNLCKYMCFFSLLQSVTFSQILSITQINFPKCKKDGTVNT